MGGRGAPFSWRGTVSSDLGDPLNYQPSSYTPAAADDVEFDASLVTAYQQALNTARTYNSVTFRGTINLIATAVADLQVVGSLACIDCTTTVYTSTYSASGERYDMI